MKSEKIVSIYSKPQTTGFLVGLTWIIGFYIAFLSENYGGLGPAVVVGASIVYAAKMITRRLDVLLQRQSPAIEEVKSM